MSKKLFTPTGGIIDKMNDNIVPLPGEIAEALRHSNGWVYRIAAQFNASENVPPDAIAGAWQVNEKGVIVGKFKSNPNFNSSKCGNSAPPA